MNLNPNIGQARKHHIAWWNQKGLVLNLTAPQSNPVVKDVLGIPSDPRERWTDIRVSCEVAEYNMGKTRYYADSLPLLCAVFGPGSLGEILGAKPVYEPTTVWYESCVSDPDTYGPIRFNSHGNAQLDLHVRYVDEAVRCSKGRYMVAMGDLIENLDTLATLRGNEELLFDLIERPSWIHKCQQEILQAFYEVFDLFYQKTKDEQGGNAFVFDIWGPGRTCKVQCDFSCMISPEMFKEFAMPYFKSQCDWLDYSLFHLDGETALQHLDDLLSIDSLDAIEWTPMGASGENNTSPTGGSQHWYDLYRRIKAAGKSVQAIGVKPDEVLPLIEAVGPEGLYVCCRAPDEATAEKIVQKTEQFM